MRRARMRQDTEILADVFGAEALIAQPRSRITNHREKYYETTTY